MISISQIKIRHDGAEKDINAVLHKKIAGMLRLKASCKFSFDIVKHSVDARKKPDIFDVYTVKVSLADFADSGKKEEDFVSGLGNSNIKSIAVNEYKLPDTDKNRAVQKRPVIAGSGPAGLFCAYMLAKAGLSPVLIERGKRVDERYQDVKKFWENGLLLEDSNVQFGEGGAGTFSDGKLYTSIGDKSGKLKEILKIFVKHGANENILYEAEPHIGTDVLVKVVRSIRSEIISNGGEVRFGCKLNKINIQKGRVEGVETSGGDIESDRLILAIGHSARDTFEMLDREKIFLEPKSFAVGFRAAHLQSLINIARYGKSEIDGLNNASYKLTAQTSSSRSVYSFCMCPGGYIVNASSEQGRSCVNGMSYSKRDGYFANSAIVCAVGSEDFEGKYIFSGLDFQRRIEEKAYGLADGKIPIQYLGEYRSHEVVDTLLNDRLGECFRGKYEFADLSGIYPGFINEAVIEAFDAFEKKIRGFSGKDTVLAGVESRTSSPIRITRGKDYQSLNVKGLYPCGEGAGYAGGIMSAALDGINVAESIILCL